MNSSLVATNTTYDHLTIANPAPKATLPITISSSASATSSNVKSKDEIDIEKDMQTFSLTLSAEQRKLLLYTGIGIAGYVLIRHLISKAISRNRRYDD